MKWEQIDNYHQRCKVPGGWIVKAFEDVVHLTERAMEPGWDFRIALCFVPDPKHEWEIATQAQPEEACCENCKFWLFVYDTPIGDEHGTDCTGACRRFPPTVEGVDEYEGSMFLLTYGSSLCGEYLGKTATGPLRSCD